MNSLAKRVHTETVKLLYCLDCKKHWVLGSNQVGDSGILLHNAMHLMQGCLKRVSVTTTASVCKPTTWATWALLFWPTWPESLVCKPTTVVETERGFR